MYTPALALHSLLRWAMLALGGASLVRSARAWKEQRDWEAEDEVLARTFMMVFFLQLALGYILLAELSPVTAAAFRDIGTAMKDPALRFFAAEHPAGMVFAFLVTMAGRVRTRNEEAGATRHRDWLLGLSTGALILLWFIPWPGTSVGRPWLRWFF